MRLLLVAQAADALTYLALPNGTEANPFWLAQPIIPALAAKAALLLLVLSVGYVLARTGRPRLRDALWGFGALAGAFGAGTNYVHMGGL